MLEDTIFKKLYVPDIFKNWELFSQQGNHQIHLRIFEQNRHDKDVWIQFLTQLVVKWRVFQSRTQLGNELLKEKQPHQMKGMFAQLKSSQGPTKLSFSLFNQILAFKQAASQSHNIFSTKKRLCGRGTIWPSQPWSSPIRQSTKPGPDAISYQGTTTLFITLSRFQMISQYNITI